MDRAPRSEDTAQQLARTERALQVLRREVETLRCERLELLEQIEFLSRVTNGSALEDSDAPTEVNTPVGTEEQTIAWLDGDTQVDPPNVHRLPRRRTKSEACLVSGEFIAVAR